MENAFDLKYGVAGICVMLTILVLIHVAKFFLAVKAEKEAVSNQTMVDLTAAVEKLTLEMKLLEVKVVSAEKALTALPKFNIDVRRFYTAIKSLAGERWPAIRAEILEDDSL